MANCEICGKESVLSKSEVEGTILEVCKNCGSFGSEINVQKHQGGLKSPKSIQLPESTEVVVSDFAFKIRTVREKKNMTQEEFAKSINEKLSILQKIENGSFTPEIPATRKLERLLNLKLVENAKDEQLMPNKKSSDQVTIGDIIRLKDE